MDEGVRHAAADFSIGFGRHYSMCARLQPRCGLVLGGMGAHPCQDGANMLVLALPYDLSHRAANFRAAMPSLFRFLAAVAIIAGVIYGGMLALTLLVQPQSREISVTIPQDRFSKPR
jgi:hypothetical protein